jgi:hypothetical protein
MKEARSMNYELGNREFGFILHNSDFRFPLFSAVLLFGLLLVIPGRMFAQTPADTAKKAVVLPDTGAKAAGQDTTAARAAGQDTTTEVPVSDTGTGGVPKGEHELGTQVIQAQEKLKIEDLKPPFFPKIDPYEPINSVLRLEKYVYDDHVYTTIDSLSVPGNYLHSSYLRTPVVDRLIRGDVLVFLPKFENNVSNWELAVSNSDGQTVRRVDRKGNPPNIITWDGRDDQGNVINTGETYDFTFFAYDAIGNQTRIPGRPQRISGMLYQDNGEWIVSVAADGIFETRDTRLVAGADRWLTEIANAVKENFKNEVVVYVYTDQEDLSTERANIIVAELNNRIKLPKDAIKSASRFVPGLQPKFSKVEVHIR